MISISKLNDIIDSFKKKCSSLKNIDPLEVLLDKLVDKNIQESIHYQSLHCFLSTPNLKYSSFKIESIPDIIELIDLNDSFLNEIKLMNAFIQKFNKKQLEITYNSQNLLYVGDKFRNLSFLSDKITYIEKYENNIKVTQFSYSIIKFRNKISIFFNSNIKGELFESRSRYINHIFKHSYGIENKDLIMSHIPNPIHTTNNFIQKYKDTTLDVFYPSWRILERYPTIADFGYIEMLEI